MHVPLQFRCQLAGWDASGGATETSGVAASGMAEAAGTSGAAVSGLAASGTAVSAGTSSVAASGVVASGRAHPAGPHPAWRRLPDHLSRRRAHRRRPQTCQPIGCRQPEARSLRRPRPARTSTQRCMCTRSGIGPGASTRSSPLHARKSECRWQNKCQHPRKHDASVSHAEILGCRLRKLRKEGKGLGKNGAPSRFRGRAQHSGASGSASLASSLSPR